MTRFFKPFGLGLAILLLTAAAVPAAAEDAPALVDINQASADELIELPRIGPAIAARVIEYREQNGGFTSVDELVNVRGIGAKTFAQLRDLVTVTAPAIESTEEPAAASADEPAKP